MRKLTKGIVIYYRIDCLAVKMAPFHLTGHVCMDGCSVIKFLFMFKISLIGILKCNTIGAGGILMYQIFVCGIKALLTD